MQAIDPLQYAFQQRDATSFSLTELAVSSPELLGFCHRIIKIIRHTHECTRVQQGTSGYHCPLPVCAHFRMLFNHLQTSGLHAERQFARCALDGKSCCRMSSASCCAGGYICGWHRAQPLEESSIMP